MALLLLALGLFQSRRWVWGALALAAAISKPQLLLLPAGGLLLAHLRQGKGRQTLAMALWLGLFALLLTIPLWLAYPGWVSDFAASLQGNPLWYQPGLLSRFVSLWGVWGWPAWLAVFGVALLGGAWCWQKLPARQALYWNLALTTLAAPYLWSWDFVLLLPLFIDTFGRARSPATRLILIGVWLLGLLLTPLALAHTPGDESLWWFPWLTFAGILVGIGLEHKRQTRGI